MVFVVCCVSFVGSRCLSIVRCVLFVLCRMVCVACDSFVLSLLRVVCVLCLCCLTWFHWCFLIVDRCVLFVACLFKQSVLVLALGVVYSWWLRFVARCVLFVACWSLFVDCGLSLIVCCFLFAVRCVLRVDVFCVLFACVVSCFGCVSFVGCSVLVCFCVVCCVLGYLYLSILCGLCWSLFVHLLCLLLGV